jgi:biopolymer transport protein ExbD
MARQFILQKRLKKKPAFELTPLIDVMFILVLFFAVSTSFHENQTGIKLRLPSAVSVETPEKAITISIDRNQRIFWNGVRIPESDIYQNVGTQIRKNPKQQVLVQADQQTPYSRVVSVLDAIRRAGCSLVMLETEKM